MTKALSRFFALVLAMFNTLVLIFGGFSGNKGIERFKPFWGGGMMKISDVSYTETAADFTADGIRCRLQFESPHGWRLRTAKEDGTFDDYGAGQTLARDLGEEIADTVQPLTVDAQKNVLTAPDGSRAELKKGKGVVIYKPNGEKAYNVDVIFRGESGNLHVAGDLDPFEALYGTGEKYNSLDQHGNRVEIFSMDVWSVEDGRSYIQIPIVASSRGCGLFMNRFEHQFLDLGHYAMTRFDFEITGETADLYIFPTDQISDVLYGYSLLTGFAAEPAEWMYGTQICRYHPEFSTAQGVYDMAAAMEENDFPWDAVIIEGFDAFNRGKWNELQEIADFVHGLGKKLMVYTQCGYPGGYNEPYMLHNGAGSTNINRVNATWDKGYGYMSKNTFSYLDITNRDALNWWYTGTWKQMMDRFGIDGAKIDFCEDIPDYKTSPETTMVFSDGRDTFGTHHWYPVAYNTMLFNFLNENASDGAMVFARGGGIGAQRYPLSWSGDQKREFTFLKTQLRACLSCGLSGMPFMSYDMAGYVPPRNNDPEAEVFIRGLEYTCFSANIETHGYASRAYDFDDGTKNLYRIYANMHDAMRPYLVEFGKVGCETAVPLMRALVLYDQDDETCRSTWNEYMLGDAFLVAPVLDKNTKARSLYLPEGSWTDLYTGKVYEGGQTLLGYKAPLCKIPVFVNNNSQSTTLTETLAAMKPYIDEINALCG